MSALRHRKGDADQPGEGSSTKLLSKTAAPPKPSYPQSFFNSRVYEETPEGKLRSEKYELEHNLNGRGSGLPCSFGTLVFCFSMCCLLFIWLLILPENPTKKVFHPSALALYNGEGPNPMYIAILGQVFDVTKGKDYYGKGKGYNCFVGRDASLAFITGEFEKDLTDDVLSLSDEELLSLLKWRDFYHEKYSYKGRLYGRFYDEHGNELPALQKVVEAAARGKLKQEEEEKHKEVYPGCNSRWSQEEGGTVSCDNEMYPRKIQEEVSGGPPTWRCACFKELGWSDLRQVYDDCDPDAHECQISPPMANES